MTDGLGLRSSFSSPWVDLGSPDSRRAIDAGCFSFSAAAGRPIYSRLYHPPQQTISSSLPKNWSVEQVESVVASLDAGEVRSDRSTACWKTCWARDHAVGCASV
jgi:hypothetical protein